MDAKQCDRCGEFYIPYHLENGEYYVRKEAHTHNVYESCDTTPDLCPECLKSLRSWFEDVNEIAREKEPPNPNVDRMALVQQTVDTILSDNIGDTDVDKAFRNAARFVQNAIDGTESHYENIDRNKGEEKNNE